MLDDAGFAKRMHGLPAAPMIWTLRVLDRLRLSPVYRWIYETASTDFCRLDREGRANPRLRAAVLQSGRTAAQLPLVSREPRTHRGPVRRHTPRAVEAGRAGHGQVALLCPSPCSAERRRSWRQSWKKAGKTRVSLKPRRRVEASCARAPSTAHPWVPARWHPLVLVSLALAFWVITTVITTLFHHRRQRRHRRERWCHLCAQSLPHAPPARALRPATFRLPVTSRRDAATTFEAR